MRQLRHKLKKCLDFFDKALYNNNVNQNQVIAKLKSTGIESAEKEDRLYDVKVEIYDKSVGLSDISGKDPIVTFTGSMVE